MLGVPGEVDAIPRLARRLMELLRQVAVDYQGHHLRAAGNLGFANCPATAALPRDVIHAAGEALDLATERGVNVWRTKESATVPADTDA